MVVVVELVEVVCESPTCFVVVDGQQRVRVEVSGGGGGSSSSSSSSSSRCDNKVMDIAS